MSRALTPHMGTLALSAVLVATATFVTGCGAAAVSGERVSNEASRPLMSSSPSASMPAATSAPRVSPSPVPSASPSPAAPAAPSPEYEQQTPPVLDDGADQPTTPAALTFAHGDVLEGYASPSSGSWPGRPEYAQIDWSAFRGYWTTDGQVVLVDPARTIPRAVVADLQARLDSMGVGGGVETPDANGIRPSEDLILRLMHVGKQLITVRPYAAAGTLEWRASTTGGTLVSGTDRDAVLQLAQDWVAAASDPAAWVVAAASPV